MSRDMNKAFVGKLPLLLFPAFILSACVSEQAVNDGTEPVVIRRAPTPAEVEQHNAMSPPEDRIVCRSETPVGTHIPARVCRLARDIEETGAFHREQLMRAL